MAEGPAVSSSLQPALLINFHYLTLSAFLPLAISWILCKCPGIYSATVLKSNHEVHMYTNLNLKKPKNLLTENHFTSYFNNTDAIL